MHFAAQGNQPKILHYLRSIGFIDLESNDNNGCTPLHWACVSGSYQALRYLLAEGADPNTKTLNDGCTPLHLAIKYMDETREVRSIHKLLIYGASVDIQVIFLMLIY
jgi:ankyrin repeat protein